MTDQEACLHLGIKPESWYAWKSKSRNESRNVQVLTQARAAAIDMQIRNIEDGAIGAGPHKRADWRASHALLGIIDPSRFGQQQGQDASRPAVHAPQTVNVWLTAVYADKPAGQVVDVQAKQIADAPSCGIDTPTNGVLSLVADAKTPQDTAKP